MSEYRQALRRNLLNSHRYLGIPAPYRKAFYISLGLSSVFAVILILFILQPTIPGKLHYALRSDQSARMVTDSRSENRQEKAPAYILTKENTNAPTPNGFGQLHSSDLDEIFVKLLSENHLNRTPIKIEPIAPSEFYSINRFRLDDGNDVIVYTQYPGEKADIRESF